MKGYYLGNGALAVTCNPHTFSVGDTLTITITITNNGNVSLPSGVVNRVYMPNTPDGAIGGDAVNTSPIAPGSSYQVIMTLGGDGRIPSSWAGSSIDVNVLVFENAETANSGSALDGETCPGVINVGAAPTVSVDITSITAS